MERCAHGPYRGLDLSASRPLARLTAGVSHRADYYKTKQAYVAWGEDATDDGSRASRFTKSRIAAFDVDKANEDIVKKVE